MTFQVKCIHVSNDGKDETATLVQPGSDLPPFKIKVPIGTIGLDREFHMWHSDASSPPLVVSEQQAEPTVPVDVAQLREELGGFIDETPVTPPDFDEPLSSQDAVTVVSGKKRQKAVRSE